jgi:hypothetical protein
MDAPMRLAFVPDTVGGPDFGLELEKSERQRLARHLVEGEASLAVGNQLPMGVAGWLVVTADSGAAEDPKAVVDSILLPFGVRMGRMDRTGRCVAPADTSFDYTLDVDQMTLFRRAPLKTQVILALPETDTLTFYSTDRVGFEALLTMKVRVKP